MDTPYANLADRKNLTNAVVQLGRDAAILAGIDPAELDRVTLFDEEERAINVLEALDMVANRIQTIKLRVAAHRLAVVQNYVASFETI